MVNYLSSKPIKIHITSTVELKQKLISKIEQTEDNTLLEEMLRLLNIETTDLNLIELSEKQKEAIDEAREQIKNGQYLTDEQANQEVDEWLKK